MYWFAVNGRNASAFPLNPQSLCRTGGQAQWASRYGEDMRGTQWQPATVRIGTESEKESHDEAIDHDHIACRAVCYH
jgi:hypothetical protein